MRQFRNLFICAVFLLLAIAASAGSAWANTAAGVRITNSATLSYSGGTAATATADVNVILKATKPNITITGGNSNYTGVNALSIHQTVVITATSNGPDDYNVLVTTGAQTNNGSIPTGSANTETPYRAAAATSLAVSHLGATVTIGASGPTYVTVPPTAGAVAGNDASAIINGIKVGAHILIVNENNSHSHEVTVTSIAIQGDGTYKIQWASAQAIDSGDVPGYGNVVGERRYLDFYAYPGTVQAYGTPITVAVNATATNSGLSIDTSASPAANSWTTPASATVSLVKYVRNVTTPVAGTYPLHSFTINSVASNFYPNGPANEPTGVTGKPGEVLEYVLMASNTSDTTDLNGCAIADIMPTTYVTFTTGAMDGGYGAAGSDVYHSPDGVNGSFLAAGASGQAVITPSSPNPASATLTVNVGLGANATTRGTIVKEAASGTPTNAFIAYRVKIN